MIRFIRCSLRKCHRCVNRRLVWSKKKKKKKKKIAFGFTEKVILFISCFIFRSIHIKKKKQKNKQKKKTTTNSAILNDAITIASNGFRHYILCRMWNSIVSVPDHCLFYLVYIIYHAYTIIIHSMVRMTYCG